MTADSLLSRLDKPRRTGEGRWMARCPAHNDKRPSLTVRELPDGRVLLHCFGGCDAHAVVSAVGLELSDLFPEKPLEPGKSERRPFPSADVLRAIGFEVTIVLIAGSRLLAGEPFDPVDHDRLRLAVGRIQSAIDAAGLTNG